MSKQDIADFEATIQKVCEKYRKTLTHCELVGTLDTVKMGYHIHTLQSFEDTEMCETPVIKDEQALPKPEPMKKLSGSPLPMEVANA